MSNQPILDFSGSTPTVFQNVQSLIQNVLNQVLVRPTSNNISGFIFDIIEDDEITLDSDITDHYLETNASLQDHIALKPIRFTVKGFVGELVNVDQQQAEQIFQSVKTLTTVGGFLPQFASQSAQFYATINSVSSQVSQYINQAKNFASVFSLTSTTSTKQQQAYAFFYNMWKSRQTCIVETPFDILLNMAIEKICVIQRGESKMISDFSITFKQMNFTNSTTTAQNLINNLGAWDNSLVNPIVDGRASQALSPQNYLGKININGLDPNGNPLTVDSVLSKWFTPVGTLTPTGL